MTEIREIVFSETTIADKVEELAKRISRDYLGKDLILVCILKGAVLFTADLMRAVSIPLQVDFLHVSSYGNATSSSQRIILKKDLDLDIRGKHVLLVDTIIDSGCTMDHLFRTIRERGPASLNAAALLDKKARRIVSVPIAYSGFEVPDVFVVGYGMDCGEQYRNLPYIAALKTAHQ